MCEMKGFVRKNFFGTLSHNPDRIAIIRPAIPGTTKFPRTQSTSLRRFVLGNFGVKTIELTLSRELGRRQAETPLGFHKQQYL